MKIVLLRELNPFHESSASGNRYTSLIKGLAEQGVQISVVVTGGYNNPDEKQKYGKQSRQQGVEFIYLLSTLNHTLWRRRINKYLFSYFSSWLVRWRLKRLLKNEYNYFWLTNNYQILNFFNHNFRQIQRSFIEINEFHDVYLQLGNITNRIQVKYARQLQQAFLLALGHIGYCAVMTRTLLKYYKTLNPTTQYLHLPMTVDLSRFDQSKNSETIPYIAFAGTLSNRKDGVDILIRAFSRIAGKYPDIELHLAGGFHPDVKIQKQLILDLGLERRVKYVGLLSKTDIPSFFINASILALARPNSHQAQGGFPTKLGEYLATKNPVCVTKVGEIPDYLEDNVSAFLASPGDVEAFADALDRALSDKVHAESVGCNGYRIALKHFNMQVQTKRLYEFLKNNYKE